MDIAKYIGLYLLKNQYCYVHGLGNLELRKIRASHDGTALQAPSWEVILSPGGSIDDSFANFIATNEQISISKAANTLREYSTQARKDLAEGKEIYIPNIGKLIETAGKISFVTDEKFAFTPPGIPVVKNSKQLEEQNSRLSHKPSYPPPASADSINWRMVILVAVFIIILGGGGFFAYKYMSENSAPQPAVVETPVVQDTVVPDMTPVIDTMEAQIDTVDSAAAMVTDSTLENDFRIIIGNYHTRERAEKRVSTLTINGNKVEMVEQDSTNYLVVTTISCRIMDTTRVKDSLRLWFGFKGVAIIQ